MEMKKLFANLLLVATFLLPWTMNARSLDDNSFTTGVENSINNSKINPLGCSGHLIPENQFIHTQLVGANLQVNESTPCVQTAPYTNNFENYDINTIPLCWDNSMSTSPTMATNPNYIWGVYSYDGNKMLRMFNYFVEPGLTAINTNPFVIPNDGNTYQMIVDVSHRADCGALTVAVSNDGGSTFTTLASIYPSYIIDFSDPGEFTTHTYDLNSYAGDTIILRFSANANFSDGSIFIDNLSLHAVNPCAEPTNISAITHPNNSVSLYWTPADSSQHNFVVAYGTGADPETMDTMSVTGTSTVITGLSAETDYNIFVKAICNDSSESYWSTGVSAYIGYCIPSPISVDNQGITNVSFGFGTETVNNSQRLIAEPYYGNYSSMIGATEINDIVNLSITYRTGYSYGTIIWVDWNKNLTFDGSEVVYVGQSSGESPTVLNASFSVPSAFDTGYYRMRIAGADSYYDDYTGSIAAAANADPCPNGYYTIVHDYTLHVISASSCSRPNNVAVSNITHNSATISWDLIDSTQNNFVVAYGTGSDPDEMDTVTSTTTTANITGLNDGTNYNVFVKSVCGVDDHSYWSIMNSFNTNFCDTTNQCPVFVHMFDSYGDGWNGNSRLNIVDALTNITVASFKLENANDSYYSFDSVYVCRGREYGLAWQTGSYDEEISFVIIAANGDTLFNITEPISGVILSFTASCPSTDDSISITFAVNDSTMGTITPTIGQYTYHVGDTVIATATANTGFHFNNWTIDSDVPSDDTSSVLNPLSLVLTEDYIGLDVTITANFDIDQFTVTALSNNDSMGTVTGSGTYNANTTATLVATPASNCRFVEWNDGDTNASRTIVITSDTTLTAIFDYRPATIVLANADTNMGTITSAPGTYSYYVGDTINISATPNEGYIFDYWTISMDSVTDTQYISTISTVVNEYQANAVINIVAHFAQDTIVTIILSINDTTMGYTTPAAGTYTFAVGDMVTAQAFAYEGYHFEGWSAMGTSISLNPLMLPIPAEAGGMTIPVTAVFAPDSVAPQTDSVTIILSINDTTMGYTTPVAGIYTFAVGEIVTAEAVAYEGYHFEGWSAMGTTITLNPLMLPVPAEAAGMTISVTAIFAPDSTQGISTATSAQCNIYPNPANDATTISVTGVNGKVNIAIVDMNGRTIITENMECAADCVKTLDVANLAQGAYFVRIIGENINMVKKLVVR